MLKFSVWIRTIWGDIEWWCIVQNCAGQWNLTLKMNVMSVSSAGVLLTLILPMRGEQSGGLRVALRYPQRYDHMVVLCRYPVFMIILPALV